MACLHRTALQRPIQAFSRMFVRKNLGGVSRTTPRIHFMELSLSKLHRRLSCHGWHPPNVMKSTVFPKKQTEIQNKNESRTRLKKVYFKVYVFTMHILMNCYDRQFFLWVRLQNEAGGSLSRMNWTVHLCRYAFSVFSGSTITWVVEALTTLGNLHAHSVILWNVSVSLPPRTRRACNQVRCELMGSLC